MRYTEDMLRVELLEAQARGRMPEVRDLTLLLQYAREPVRSSDVYAGAIKAARNRQAQRRWHRDPSDARAKWREGDYVLAPDGSTLVLEARDAQAGMYVCRLMTEASGTGRIRLTPDQMKRPPAGKAPMVVLSDAGDALYHACWDKLEGGTDDALRAALAAYEAALASLGL